MSSCSDCPLRLLKGAWEFRPTRAVLLGTIDKGSVLYRLPKSDGVLNIILGFVVLYYAEEVLAQRVLDELIRDYVCAGQQGRRVEGSEARQPDAVADGARGMLCARPRERHRGLRKYCSLQCGPALVKSSADVLPSVLHGASVTNEIEKYSAEILSCVVLRCVM